VSYVQLESEPELEASTACGGLKKTPSGRAAVNPDVAAPHAEKITRTYENKFGIAFEQIGASMRGASKLKHLASSRLQMHIGSQITDVSPFEQAVRKVLRS